MFSVWVEGKPQPQGSKKGYVINGKAVLVESAKGNKVWRKTIQDAIAAKNPQIINSAVHVSIAFYFERAKSNTKPAHTQKPDIDKLCRSVLDALTEKLIIDDSYVTSISAYKYWATSQEKPGAYIQVWAVDEHGLSIDTPTT